jgi:outer membrane receptor protein involved in Fe transport
LVYEKPQSRALSGRFLANIRIEFIPHRNFRWFAQVDNLFNAGYEEFDFIKAAGRFWKTGVTAQF